MKISSEQRTYIERVTPEKFNDKIAKNKSKSDPNQNRKRSLLFKEQEVAFLYEHYKGRSNKELTELLNTTFKTNFTVQQVKGYKSNHHLNSGLSGHFKKGHIPSNKGTKGFYNSGGNSGSFKKGNIPKNHLEIGSEVLRSDGYIAVKVKEPNVWKLKHRLIWERKYGEIPPGQVLLFLDGNKQHVTLDNLALVDKKLMATLNRNQLLRSNKEETKVAIRIAEIYQAIAAKKK
ncbi:HNH endonuclease signature motif containing protein [Listeria grayi]|uniref:HNH endonuclease signature motif containing protein n=1 Tax=Listeria grayi TaxID=1641 RepID=UPI00162540B9|nr:HNH endonuclease signature motif containing protein [Listeria grayi]MBC1922973.1 HNH endonuclease [Listeria grayi]